LKSKIFESLHETLVLFVAVGNFFRVTTMNITSIVTSRNIGLGLDYFWQQLSGIILLMVTYIFVFMTYIQLEVLLQVL